MNLTHLVLFHFFAGAGDGGVPPISGGGLMWIHHHHHANGAWLLPFLLLIAGCRGVPWWQ